MEIIIMAQLSSPGVSVSVEDESFYTPAGAGTIPLIIVASASNKLNGASTGIAPGTLAKNDGKVYLLTSQKDLTDTYGTPIFKTDSSNNPIHAGEQNEYGLQAAYSFLGVSNRAYVARADVNLNELTGATAVPRGAPVDNAFWLDTAASHWGIFKWNSESATTVDGQKFANIVPRVITDTTQVADYLAHDYSPKGSIGKIGDYAFVAVTSLLKLWYKKPQTNTPAGTWVEVGTDEWKASIPTVIGSNTVTGTAPFNDVSSVENGPQDVLTINEVNIAGFSTLASLVTLINGSELVSAMGITAAAIDNKLQLYTTGSDIDLTGTLDETATTLGVENGTVNYDTGIYKSPALTISAHTSVPMYKRKDDKLTVNNRPTNSLWIKTTAVNKGADLVVSKYIEAGLIWKSVSCPVYKNSASAINALDSTRGGLNIPGNTVYAKFNVSEDALPTASLKVFRRSNVGATTIESSIIQPTSFPAGTYSFNMAESVLGSDNMSAEVTISFTIDQDSSVAVVINKILAAITSSGLNNVDAIALGETQLVISHITGGEILFDDGTGTPISRLFSTISTINFYAHPAGNSGNYVASLWSEFTTDKTSSFITPSDSAPTGGPVDGQLWYDNKIEEVDIMVNNGTTWVAYRNFDHGDGVGATNAKGPIVSPTRPKVQSDGVSQLKAGDLWIDTSDTENYPQMYKFDSFTKLWQLIDKTDQTSEDGVLFGNARWNTNGIATTPSTIVELLGGTGLTEDARIAANFLDFDAPNPALYPTGMLLWNLRRSGYNVKRYHATYVDHLARNPRWNNESMANYFEGRWVSDAANNEDGSGAFGRRAQRKVVVQSLQALVNKNLQIRDEERRVFNLIACPGYPELVGEMKILNYDRGITAFVIADTPARLPADATSLSNWGMNAALAVEDNDYGLTSSDPYMAFYYPWGYTSDNLGNNIVVPPSHMMLRTYALNDASSYLWFAPAGTSRGVINNATSVGYVDGGGEFQTVGLNRGQRDTLASVKVNPIAFIAGSGHVVYGQYTRASVASALDRVNVARLVAFLRVQFSTLTKPYLFAPNDESTRKQIKHAAEAMLLELMGQRALYDFIVVCDTSNNTPDRIDRSELWLDVAIEPTKAVEFIYIPMRLKNTGEIKGLG
jgi:hypothetical protein